MDLSKQKILTVGLCRLQHSELPPEDNDLFALPAYIFDVAGIKCALMFRFTMEDEECWTLCDMEYGKMIEPDFVYFNEVVKALEDDSWVLKEHERLADAGVPAVAQPNDVFFQVNNPLKGVPGVVLLPSVDTDDELDYDEEVSDEEIEATIQDILNEQDDLDDGDESDGDFSIDPDTRMDWDKFIRVSTAEDDPETEFDDDLLYSYTGYGSMDVTLEPVCAFVSRIGSHRIAFSLRMTGGPYALWNAFDITLGTLLCTSMSLAELMRIAPLMIPIVESSPAVSLDMVDYVHELTELLSGSGQSVQRYLDDGYLKLNGAQYIRLMNRLFVDKGSEQSVQYWAERNPEVLLDFNFVEE